MVFSSSLDAYKLSQSSPFFNIFTMSVAVIVINVEFGASEKRLSPFL